MISGLRRARDLICTLALLLGAPGVSIAHAADISFAKVLQDLGAVQSVDVPFTEVRHIAILTRPLTLHGELIYRKPDFLEKRITAPLQQRFILDGDRITLSDAQGQTRTFSLNMAPQLSGIVEAYRALLRGDRQALEFNYWTKYSAHDRHWQLVLQPKSRKLRDMIESLTIDGDGARIDTIVTAQANGDRSVMRMQAPGKGQ